MTKFFSGTLASVLFAVSALAPFANATTTVYHDGRYIYYSSSWTHLSESEQTVIIDQSVQLLQNELSQRLDKVTGLKTISNFMLEPAVLNQLTGLAQQAVDAADTYNWRNLLPAGLLCYGGGSLDIGLLANGKVSGDLGIVLLPAKVTRVDTFTNEKVTYFQLQWGFVVVPHLYLGMGVGAGGTASVGCSAIFGELDHVDDFSGWVGAGAANAQAIGGVDVELSLVRNRTEGKTFGVVTFEGDMGAEASANLDAEGGYVQPLDAWLDQVSGVKVITAPPGTPPVAPPVVTR